MINANLVAPVMEGWHNPDVAQYEFDLQKARELLAEAGFTWDDEGRLLAPTP